MHLKDRRVESTYHYNLQHSTFRLKEIVHIELITSADLLAHNKHLDSTKYTQVS